MKPRNIISNQGGEPFAVHQHIILKNFWEYYLGETDENGIAFGFVMGFASEWGSVDVDEISPHILSRASGSMLNDIMPPEGYYWEDEEGETGLSSHTAYEKKVEKTAWLFPTLMLYYIMFNNEELNEQDEQTKKLLDAICEGITLPTEEEEQEALEQQHN